MPKENLSRRDFLQITAAAAVTLTAMGDKTPAQTAASINPELEEITVVELQKKMQSGELTAEKIVQKYIERINELDKSLHSVLEINPDALDIGRQLDKERKNKKARGPLHGIPILIKDNIETADKMKTTAGSLALLDAPTPKQDAFIVQKLRQAGVIILGKTNLSEWANFRSTKSISGWSGRGGQTNNPYILSQNPCGSSSGTGAAISANLAAIGIGTETNGSITCPSVKCGLVGFKPTLGLVSRSGIVPISHSQDTAGPMTRNVSDAAALLTVMTGGADRRDLITSKAPKGQQDYTKFLDKNGLKGARIGVARQYIGRNEKFKKAIEPQLDKLKDAGAILIDVEFQMSKTFGDDELNLLLYEFKSDLNDYLATRSGKYKTLADLIKFNDENKDREMPLFGQELFIQAEAKGDLHTPEYIAILERLKLGTQANGIDAVVMKNNLDAIAAPSVGGAWGIAAVAGYPNITVPAGFVDGIPVGMSFMGRAFTEASLIKYAYAFEQMTKARETPKLLAGAPQAS